MHLPPLPRPTALLLALLLAAACGTEQRDSTLPRAKFVAVNVALRRALAAPGDTAGRRAAVLRRYDVTPAQLRAWVAERRREPEQLAEVWEEIAKGIRARDSIAATDSVRRDSVARDSVRRDRLRRDSASAVPLVQVPPAELVPQG